MGYSTLTVPKFLRRLHIPCEDAEEVNVIEHLLCTSPVLSGSPRLVRNSVSNGFVRRRCHCHLLNWQKPFMASKKRIFNQNMSLSSSDDSLLLAFSFASPRNSYLKILIS